MILKFISIRKSRSGCKISLVIKYAIIRQVRFVDSMLNTPIANNERSVVEFVIIAPWRTDNNIRILIFTLLNQLFNMLMNIVNKTWFEPQIISRISCENHFRKNDKVAVFVVMPCSANFISISLKVTNYRV